MITKQLSTIASTLVMVTCLVSASWAQSPTMKMTTDTPESIKAPDKVETSIGTLNYFDGVPTEETVKTVYDYLDRARALESFLGRTSSLVERTGRCGLCHAAGL